MRRLFALILDAYAEFVADDGWAMSSHIALTTLTSLFPFLIFVTTLAGFFGSEDLSDEAAKLLFDAWPAVVAQPIANEVHHVLTAQRGGLLTISAVLALYFASNAIEAVRTGLNRSYEMAETRPWWLLRMESIAYIAIGALSLLALAFLVVLGPLIWESVLRFAPGMAPLQNLVTAARLGIASILLIVSLFVAHLWLPIGRRRFIDVAPGVSLTFVSSIAFGEIFGAWIAQYATNYVSTYAGLASVMIALVFLYSVAALFVFGGELNAAVTRARHARRAAREAAKAGAAEVAGLARAEGVELSEVETK
jgi:membrane protein